MPPRSPLPNPLVGGTPHSRVVLFALLCVLSAAGVVAYGLHSRQRGSAYSQPVSSDREQLVAILQRPHLIFRNTALGPSFGCLSVVDLDALDGVRHATDLPCERVYGSATLSLCLQASRGVFTTYRAVSFDQSFQVLNTFNLAGTPSRTRVSNNGRMAATTVFVTGDSYNSGGFSTRTSLIDLPTAKVIGDLEDFTVTKEGQLFKKADFNFWGITFAQDGGQFFATLASGGVLYLVEGHTSRRDLRVVREGVECPSLSPDGVRLAFKSRTVERGRMVWKLRVLNFKTGAETTIDEGQSVDDQAEWLDRDHVLYGLPRNVPGSASCDIWVARADGTEPSRVFLADAFSPCVIRP